MGKAVVSYATVAGSNPATPTKKPLKERIYEWLAQYIDDHPKIEKNLNRFMGWASSIQAKWFEKEYKCTTAIYPIQYSIFLYDTPLPKRIEIFSSYDWKCKTAQTIQFYDTNYTTITSRNDAWIAFIAITEVNPITLKPFHDAKSIYIRLDAFFMLGDVININLPDDNTVLVSYVNHP